MEKCHELAVELIDGLRSVMLARMMQFPAVAGMLLAVRSTGGSTGASPTRQGAKKYIKLRE